MGGLTRIDGDDPTALAQRVSEFRFGPGGAQAAIIATDRVIVDALASVPLAARTNASVLLTSPDALAPGVVAELQRVLDTPYASKTVYIAGGLEALPQHIADQLAAAGFTKQQRFAGENRDDTARLVALEIVARNATPLSKVVVSENQAFADTLGVGSVAAQPDANGDVTPILLTKRASTTLSPFLTQFLQSQPQLTQVSVVGGPAAVDPAAIAAIRALLPSAQVTVYQGDNRYGSNAAINKVAFGGTTTLQTVVIASGEAAALPGAITTSSATAGSAGFFAALLAGTIGADEAAPVVLTRQAALPQENIDFLTPLAASITKVIIVGGTGAVSAAVEQQVRSLVL
jgi:putative cell wall-binding protein